MAFSGALGLFVLIRCNIILLSYYYFYSFTFYNSFLFNLCFRGGKLGCNKGKFSASWTPLNKIIGFNSSIEVAGVDGFWSRICQSNCFGRLFCPIGLSELEINVDLGQYKFVVSDVENNKNWAKDDKLLHSDAILGAIQIKNEERIRESKL
jgi:hypothetical protein